MHFRRINPIMLGLFFSVLIINKLFLSFSSNTCDSEHEEAKSTEALNDSSAKRAVPITSAKHTTVTIITPKPYHQGQTIKAMITSRDKTGHPTFLGGDIYAIRISNGGSNTSMAVLPSDHNNGSYTFSIPLYWDGRYEIHAMLVLSSAGVSYVKKKHLEDYVTKEWTTYAVYSDGMREERVLCNFSHTLNKDYCDLTKVNGFRPWYCQAPTELKCSDIQANNDLIKLPEDFEEHRPILHQVGVLLEVMLPVKSFSTIISESFTFPQGNGYFQQGLSTRRPRGFYRNDEWISLSHSNRRFTPEHIVDCISNKTFLFFGDSNARLFTTYIYSQLGDRKFLEFEAGRSRTYPTMNMRMRYVNHGHLISWSNPINHPMDEVFANPKPDIHMIFISVWAHFLFFPQDVLLEKFILLRSYLYKWQMSYPHVKIFVRSPHIRETVNDKVLTIGHSNYCCQEAYHLFVTVFQNTPFYILDMWEMTVAHPSKFDIHPDIGVLKETAQEVLNVVCLS